MNECLGCMASSIGSRKSWGWLLFLSNDRDRMTTKDGIIIQAMRSSYISIFTRKSSQCFLVHYMQKNIVLLLKKTILSLLFLLLGNSYLLRNLKINLIVYSHKKNVFSLHEYYKTLSKKMFTHLCIINKRNFCFNLTFLQMLNSFSC